MARRPINNPAGDQIGYYDPATCQRYDIDGMQWLDRGASGRWLAAVDDRYPETLYRTPSGRLVLEVRDSVAGPIGRELSADEAAEWLQTHGHGAEVVRTVARPAGRPQITDRVYKLRVTDDMLARVDEAAERDGVTRAEWMRRAIEAQLGA